ncbi:hypothetical protein BCD67_01130 [Oscillatoriales cyanobacterium USR001]|nr:hypothetical protein BCD67_01130 [Oscillatoriales cyanobacterium USR001]
MKSAQSNQEQQHPQYKSDRDTITKLLTGEPTDHNLAELARLKIRYRGFPGARDIQKDLDNVMQKWGYSDEETLYEKTRQIHAEGLVYKRQKNEQDDWI